MLPRPHAKHDLVTRQHSAHGVRASAERLAQDDDVRLAFVVVGREEGAGSRQASLDLVGYEEDVVLGADFLDAGHIAGWGDDDSGLALDGLHHEGGDVLGACLLYGLVQGVNISVRNVFEARHEGPEAIGAARVIAAGYGGHGAAPEVAVGEEDLGRVRGGALDVVRPPAGKLDGGLPALNAGVHRQHAVVAEVRGYVLGVRAELVVVEGPASEREPASLVHHGLDDLRVAVPLVDGRIRRQKVVILLAVHVPHVHAEAAGEVDW